jgi:hypothetical protein
LARLTVQWRNIVKDEIPDHMIDDDVRIPPAAAVHAATSYGDSSEDYLLNDIGVALRLLSERG